MEDWEAEEEEEGEEGEGEGEGLEPTPSPGASRDDKRKACWHMNRLPRTYESYHKALREYHATMYGPEDALLGSSAGREWRPHPNDWEPVNRQ